MLPREKGFMIKPASAVKGAGKLHAQKIKMMNITIQYIVKFWDYLRKRCKQFAQYKIRAPS